MPLLIQFRRPEDRVQAIDILLDAGETYSGVPKQCWLVSDAAVRLLQERGVDFETVGGPRAEEPPHGENP